MPLTAPSLTGPHPGAQDKKPFLRSSGFERQSMFHPSLQWVTGTHREPMLHHLGQHTAGVSAITQYLKTKGSHFLHPLWHSTVFSGFNCDFRLAQEQLFSAWFLCYVSYVVPEQMNYVTVWRWSCMITAIQHRWCLLKSIHTKCPCVVRPHT